MVSNKLSKIYKQYPCSILSLLDVLYETRYDQQISGTRDLPL